MINRLQHCIPLIKTFKKHIYNVRLGLQMKKYYFRNDFTSASKNWPELVSQIYRTLNLAWGSKKYKLDFSIAFVSDDLNTYRTLNLEHEWENHVPRKFHLAKIDYYKKDFRRQLMLFHIFLFLINVSWGGWLISRDNWLISLSWKDHFYVWLSYHLFDQAPPSSSFLV